MQTLKEQFESQGLTARDTALSIALASFRNNGGTYERAVDLLHAAYETGSEGHSEFAREGRQTRANASQQKDGLGQKAFAEKAIAAVPKPVSPAYVAAAKSGAKVVALTVLDTFRLRNGKAIGDASFGELREVAARNVYETSVINQAINYAGPNVDASKKVREIVPADILEAFVEKARKARNVR